MVAPRNDARNGECCPEEVLNHLLWIDHARSRSTRSGVIYSEW